MTDSANTDSELAVYLAKRKVIGATANLAMANAVEAFETSYESAISDEAIEVLQHTLTAAFRSANMVCTEARKTLGAPPKDQFEQNSTKISLFQVDPQLLRANHPTSCEAI